MGVPYFMVTSEDEFSRPRKMLKGKTTTLSKIRIRAIKSVLNIFRILKNSERKKTTVLWEPRIIAVITVSGILKIS